MTEPTKVHVIRHGLTLCGFYWPERPLFMANDVWLPEEAMSAHDFALRNPDKMCAGCRSAILSEGVVTHAKN